VKILNRFFLISLVVFTSSTASVVKFTGPAVATGVAGFFTGISLGEYLRFDSRLEKLKEKKQKKIEENKNLEEHSRLGNLLSKKQILQQELEAIDQDKEKIKKRERERKGIESRLEILDFVECRIKKRIEEKNRELQDLEIDLENIFYQKKRTGVCAAIGAGATVVLGLLTYKLATKKST